MALHYNKHVQTYYIKTKKKFDEGEYEQKVVCGDECYWNKTWKTICAVRLDISMILMGHEYFE